MFRSLFKTNYEKETDTGLVWPSNKNFPQIDSSDSWKRYIIGICKTVALTCQCPDGAARNYDVQIDYFPLVGERHFDSSAKKFYI